MPKIIKEGIVFGGGNVVDTTLDTTSTNPVENQAVATAIEQINNDLVDLRRGGAMPILNYSNPLHTFSTGNLSFTTSKECYLIGLVSHPSGGTTTLTINGTQIASSQTDLSDAYISPLKLKAGDTIVVSNTSPRLHILDVVTS